MNFESLPINKYGKYPLVIAGIDVFQNRDFILDIPGKRLYLGPKPKSGRS